MNTLSRKNAGGNCGATGHLDLLRTAFLGALFAGRPV
jgi:hypothetical protein